MFEASDLKYSINDFETILRGDKQKTSNERFNKKARNFLNILRAMVKQDLFFFHLVD